MEGRPERTITIDIWYPTTDIEGEIGTYVYGIDEDVFENATIADSIHVEVIQYTYTAMDTKVGEQPVPS